MYPKFRAALFKVTTEIFKLLVLDYLCVQVNLTNFKMSESLPVVKGETTNQPPRDKNTKVLLGFGE